MNLKQKQCIVVEFLTKEGCRLSDIHKRIQNAYVDQPFSAEVLRHTGVPYGIIRDAVKSWLRKAVDGASTVLM